MRPQPKREEKRTMTTYVNLTPHTLNVRALDGSTLVLPPSPNGAARVVYDRLPPEQTNIAGHEVQISVAGSPREIVGLPEPEEGVVYVVAKAVADAATAHRGDLMSPGKLIRDADGNVTGCDGLTRRA
jgi:hypothetical protein